MDLSTNAFFLTLQQKFSRLYAQAEEACWLICAPHGDVLTGVPLTLAMIERHLYRPSPYFQGVFESIKGGREITISADQLVPQNGFEFSAPCRILGEELFYNKKYQPFRVFIIDRVLDTSGPVVAAPGKEGRASAGKLSGLARVTVAEQVAFLSATLSPATLTALQRSLAAFSDSYVVVDGYLADARQRLGDVCTTETRRLFAEHAGLDEPTRGAVAVAVECLAVAPIGSQLRSALAREQHATTSALHARLALCRLVSVADLGLGPSMDVDLSSACGILAELPALATPVEVVDCCQRCIQRALELVSGASGASQPVMLTADDLIPLLALIVARSGATTLPVDLAFAEQFGLRLETSSEAGFSLVTLQAALEFLLSDQFPTSASVKQLAGKAPPSLSAENKSTAGMVWEVSTDPARPGWRRYQATPGSAEPRPFALTAGQLEASGKSPQSRRRDAAPPPPTAVIDTRGASASTADMGSFLTKLSLGF